MSPLVSVLLTDWVAEVVTSASNLYTQHLPYCGALSVGDIREKQEKQQGALACVYRLSVETIDIPCL